jgi:hypothetical protein
MELSRGKACKSASAKSQNRNEKEARGRARTFIVFPGIRHSSQRWMVAAFLIMVARYCFMILNDMQVQYKGSVESLILRHKPARAPE